MKKVLVLLLACLTCNIMLVKAQTQTPWGPVANPGESTMIGTAAIFIDNVEAGEEALNYSLGIFCGGEVRGYIAAPTYATNGSHSYEHYIYYLSWNGNTGEMTTFKIWDNVNDQELNVVYSDDPIPYVVNGQLTGTSRKPYHLNFTAAATSTYNKTIDGYETEGGWYVISSPVGDVNLEAVDGLINDDYDLYYFDQNGDGEGNEWINRKANMNTFTTLALGKGYLYAAKEGAELVFSGDAYSGDGVFPLDYSEENESALMHGLNLVGNPFTVAATVDMAGYMIDPENRNGFTPMDANAEIPAMEGCFVLANGDGQSVTFAPQNNGGKRPNLVINLRNGQRLADRAIVRFAEGQQLPKFQLVEGSTKVYIPMDGAEFSLVNAESMGELPVSFKAERNGSYSLSFTAQEVSFAYLHLIDNMTGTDTDLLASPSYSFEARTTDYESRFKLVFATGNANDEFAFFSNGSFIINNDGNAMLQVVDVTGRVINAETINGCASVNVDAAPGVYMLRLVNGDNVKVQKVVVR